MSVETTDPTPSEGNDLFGPKLEAPAPSAGLPVLVAKVGPDTTLAWRQLKGVCIVLAAAGLAVETKLVAGEPQRVFTGLVKAQGPALPVMGDYGYMRLRQLIVGSTTSSLLRPSDVPVVVLR